MVISSFTRNFTDSGWGGVQRGLRRGEGGGERGEGVGNTEGMLRYQRRWNAFHVLQRLGGNAWAPNEIFEWTQQEINVHAYDRFFGPLGLGAMPHRISFPCCSQFAVTRERIQTRSRFFWQQNMHFMQYNDIQASNLRPKSHMVGESPFASVFLPSHGISGDFVPAPAVAGQAA